MNARALLPRNGPDFIGAAPGMRDERMNARTPLPLDGPDIIGTAPGRRGCEHA